MIHCLHRIILRGDMRNLVRYISIINSISQLYSIIPDEFFFCRGGLDYKARNRYTDRETLYQSIKLSSHRILISTLYCIHSNHHHLHPFFYIVFIQRIQPKGY